MSRLILLASMVIIDVGLIHVHEHTGGGVATTILLLSTGIATVIVAGKTLYNAWKDEKQ